MDKYFLCLANSYKHDNRCLAGVEVSAEGKLLTNEWKHVNWFRPINRYTDAGAIPNEEASGIELFDIVKVNNIVPCPDGAQQENYYYDSLEKIGHVAPNEMLLKKISYTNRKVLFGNPQQSISHEYYERLDYSILMIEAKNVQCYLKDRINKQPQPRICFEYKQHKYDLPVTDPDFRHVIERDLVQANSADHYFLTLSLSAECEGWHFKLVAGVINNIL